MDINALEKEIREKLSGEGDGLLDQVEGSALEDYLRDLVLTLGALAGRNATESFILSNFSKRYSETALLSFMEKYWKK